MASTVDERIDAAPALHRPFHEVLEIVVRLVGAGHAEPAEVLGQRFALAR